MGQHGFHVLPVTYQQNLEKILYKLKLALTLLFLGEKCITPLKKGGKYEVATRYRHFWEIFEPVFP